MPKRPSPAPTVSSQEVLRTNIWFREAWVLWDFKTESSCNRLIASIYQEVILKMAMKGMFAERHHANSWFSRCGIAKVSCWGRYSFDRRHWPKTLSSTSWMIITIVQIRAPGCLQPKSRGSNEAGKWRGNFPLSRKSARSPCRTWQVWNIRTFFLMRMLPPPDRGGEKCPKNWAACVLDD